MLNELDHWVESNWEENPVAYKYYVGKNPNGSTCKSTKIAVTQWLLELLKLEISQEKTKVINVKRRYSEFLGFKIKIHPKGNKHTVTSHISDKQLVAKRKALVEQVKRIRKPRPKRRSEEIFLYNKMVMGMQNYYRLATNINLDASKLNRAVMTVITNRLKRISRKGRKLTPAERMRYGNSAMLRYLANEPI